MGEVIRERSYGRGHKGEIIRSRESLPAYLRRRIQVTWVNLMPMFWLGYKSYSGKKVLVFVADVKG